MPLPENIPSPRVDARLTLRLESKGRLLSMNDYEIIVGTRAWALEGISSAKGVVLFDPSGRAPDSLQGANIRLIASLDAIEPAQTLIVADAENSMNQSGDAATLRSFVEQGGRILLLGAGSRLSEMFPDMVKSYRPCRGEIVTMHVPESPIFDGIEPLDLSWFQQGPHEIPRACRGAYRIDRSHNGVTVLADVVDQHGYLRSPEQVGAISGSPLIGLHVGKGMVLASEMAVDASPNDPIAGRLLGNLVRALAVHRKGSNNQSAASFSVSTSRSDRK